VRRRRQDPRRGRDVLAPAGLGALRALQRPARRGAVEAAVRAEGEGRRRPAPGPAGDYFQFKADGSGSWTQGGHSLWNGQVIPEGKGKYRFSWQGGDPKSASYWGATLTGGKLLFAGNNQTYTKAKG
jgi:hypothetical protein